MRLQTPTVVLLLASAAACYDLDAVSRPCAEDSGVTACSAADADVGCAGNLVSDPDFDQNGLEWFPLNSEIVITADGIGSSKAARVCNAQPDTTDNYGIGTAPVPAPQLMERYRVSGLVRAASSGVQTLTWAFDDGGIEPAPLVEVGETWERLEATYAIADGAGPLGIHLRSQPEPPAGACFILDQVCLVRE